MSTTIPDVSHYTYRVSWSPEDKEFVATCLELPSLSWLAPTQDEALHGIRALVDDVVEDMHRNGEPIPEPWSSRTYSGKFNLRVGERLHRKLAMKAAEEHLSLTSTSRVPHFWVSFWPPTPRSDGSRPGRSFPGR